MTQCHVIVNRRRHTFSTWPEALEKMRVEYNRCRMLEDLFVAPMIVAAAIFKNEHSFRKR